MKRQSVLVLAIMIMFMVGCTMQTSKQPAEWWEQDEVVSWGQQDRLADFQTPKEEKEANLFDLGPTPTPKIDTLDKLLLQERDKFARLHSFWLKCANVEDDEIAQEIKKLLLAWDNAIYRILPEELGANWRQQIVELARQIYKEHAEQMVLTLRFQEAYPEEWKQKLDEYNDARLKRTAERAKQAGERQKQLHKDYMEYRLIDAIQSLKSDLY